jgi:hypothetical protein
MKLFALLLLVALVATVSASPSYRPRYVYRMDESAESEEIELEAEEADIPQDDDVSDEDDPPPKFHELFPTPTSKDGVSTHGPQNFGKHTFKNYI